MRGPSVTGYASCETSIRPGAIPVTRARTQDKLIRMTVGSQGWALIGSNRCDRSARNWGATTFEWIKNARGDEAVQPVFRDVFVQPTGLFPADPAILLTRKAMTIVGGLGPVDELHDPAARRGGLIYCANRSGNR